MQNEVPGALPSKARSRSRKRAVRRCFRLSGALGLRWGAESGRHRPWKLWGEERAGVPRYGEGTEAPWPVELRVSWISGGCTERKVGAPPNSKTP